MNTSKWRGHAAAALAVAAAIGIDGSTEAQSQADEALVKLGRQVWVSGSNCRDCHGVLGNGVADDPRSPNGANLRATSLDAAQIAEVILCGRPGTPMPYYDRRAYVDDRCYGATAADLGDQVPRQSSPAITARQANALAAFILASFAGKGDATLEECEELLGGSSTVCLPFPSAAR